MEMNNYISVLIPALNEEESIGRCLSALSEQNFPKDRYEVLVMDNGSKDKTREIAESFGVKVVDAKGKRIGGVRNLGAKNAVGSILAFIDADCVADPDWLKNGQELLADSDEVGAAGGRCFAPSDGSWVQRAWICKNSEPVTRNADILATGSFFIKKDTFVQVGGFNESLTAGEDTEISRKITESGKILVFSSLIGVAHLGLPNSIFDFLRRQIWQSTDYLKTKKNKSDPVFIAVNVFLINCILGMMLILHSTTREIGIIAIGLTFMIALILTVYRQVKNRREANGLLFLQYYVLNYFYLLGRSIGLLKSYIHVAIGSF